MTLAARLVFCSAMPMLHLASGTLTSAELVGKVVDVSGAAISATVELRHKGDPEVIRKLVADHSGVFQITDLDAGSYQLSFYAPGFHAILLDCTVSPEDYAVLDDVVLQVTPILDCPPAKWGRPEIWLSEIDAGTSLSGHTNEQDGAPIRAAIVTLTNRNNSYRIFSAPTGVFVFSNVKPGLYSLRVRHTGFADFVIDAVEIRSRHETRISDALLLRRCPVNLKCQATRNTLLVRLCL